MRRLIAIGTSALFAATMAGAPLAAPAMAASPILHAPRISLPPNGTGNGHGHGGGGGGGGGGGVGASFGWASSNWSGYAVSSSTAGTYSSITGQWTVPAVQATSGNSYSASWIGIDGFNNSSLIQTGTGQDYVSGRASYYAWWEILPAAETQITKFVVHPGDQMSATITKGSGSSWTITITDISDGTGGSFTTTQSYSGPGTSAEWIEEAPTVGGRIATLAHYGSTTFDPGTVNGGNPGLVVADGGVMIQKRVQVSTPSLPDPKGDGFSIQYGSTVPAAPGS